MDIFEDLFDNLGGCALFAIIAVIVLVIVICVAIVILGYGVSSFV